MKKAKSIPKIKIETSEEVQKFNLNNWVDKHYVYLCTLAKSIISRYKIYLLDYRDLLNEVYFRFEFIKKKFNPKFNVSFRSYFFKYARFYMQNLCRKYNSKKYSVLNNYVDYDSIEFIAKDDIPEHFNFINLDKLNNKEMKIYNLVVNENVPWKVLPKKLDDKPANIKESLTKIHKMLFG